MPGFFDNPRNLGLLMMAQGFAQGALGGQPQQRDPLQTYMMMQQMQDRLRETKEKQQQQSAYSQAVGGLDPRTGITWQTGRQAQGPEGARMAEGGPVLDYELHAQVPTQEQVNPVAGMLSRPQQMLLGQVPAEAGLPLLLEQAFKEPEQYTLGPGAGRYRGDELIAQQPFKPDTLSPEAEAQRRRIAAAGKPSTEIRLGETAEVAKIKALTGVHEKRLTRMQEQAMASADLEPRLQSIVLGLESGRVDTGPFEGALIPFRQLLRDAGFTIDENLPQAEQVRAGMAFLTPRMRVVGSGSTSDFEMRMFRQAGPQYANSTEGNILLGRSMLQIQDRNRRAYDLALQYFGNEGTLQGVDDFIEKQLGPVFPMPKTQAEYDAIRPGTVWYSEESRQFKVKR